MRGSVRGRKQSQKSPTVQPGHPRAGWARAARAVHPAVMQERGAVHFICVLKDAPKEKYLLFFPCLSTDINAN